MFKKLKSTLIINGIGFGLMIVSLFGYQGVMTYSQPIKIDQEKLKERLSQCSKEELRKMLVAGEEIEEWNALLKKTGLTIVQKVLKEPGILKILEHYPLHDTFDQETYSQYYYHAHRNGEHGHFHLFLRQGGMEEGTLPLLSDGSNQELDDIQTFAHLIAISMDDEGAPLSLFTVNRWVTGEHWYVAKDLKKMVDRFSVNHDYPSLVVNRWLKGMLILFRPQIDDLLDARDQLLSKCHQGILLKDVLEDQELDVISEEQISIEMQIKVIRELLPGSAISECLNDPFSS